MRENHETASSSQRPLFQSQRQDEITALALERGRVDVSEIAERFNVTTETIRRDLAELQSRKVLRRVHGGAVPWERMRFEPLLANRGDLHHAEKRRIGVLAAQEVPDGGTVLVDSGSTTAQVCQALPHDRPVTVVTNSVLNAQILSDLDNAEVVILGGTMRKNTMAMVDALVVGLVEQLTVDALFISCDGMSPARGLTTPYTYESAVKQAMIRAARRVIVVADHSKLDNDQLFKFADWSAVDVLITDSAVTDAEFEELQSLVPIVHRA